MADQTAKTSEMNITGRLPSVKPVIQDLKPNFACCDPQTRVSGGQITRVPLRDNPAWLKEANNSLTGCHRVKDEAKKPKLREVNLMRFFLV